MLDKKFKCECGLHHTDGNKSLNGVIDYIMYYDGELWDEYHEEKGIHTLIVLREGVIPTGVLLDRMGLIRINNSISISTPDCAEDKPDNRIFIHTGMTEDEVNKLVNLNL